MLKYWLWLADLTAMPGLQSTLLLDHFGSPEKAYYAEETEYDLIPGLMAGVKQALKQKSFDRVEKILEDCDRLGIRILTIQDTEYPNRLKQIDEPPCVLYIKGRLPLIDEEVAIAMVGARISSPYGEMAAARLSMELTREGALIVTGIARGIDAASIKGALKAGGRVVSVLGNGADVIYPRENEGIYADVASMGALIGEYPPGTQALGSHFPIRNRIISGLSLGTVVVEGGGRSGSLITARLALEQNRDVFAIPGNIDTPMSQAPNRLIACGEAQLITCAWDILEDYSFLYPQKIKPKAPLPQKVSEARIGVRAAVKLPEPIAESVARPQGVAVDLTEEEGVILKVLEGRLLTADDIIEKTDLSARQILSALTMLQVKQLVTEEAGKRFTAS